MALAAHCFVALGLYLPVPVLKDLSKPFPCMHSKCGCTSAAQCWKSCCCKTDREKLVWALENGVEPDGELVQRLARSEQVVQSVSRSCCRHAPSSRRGVAAGAEKTSPKSGCCNRSDRDVIPEGSSQTATAGASEDLQPGEIVLSDAMRCSGGKYELFASAPAVLAGETRSVVSAVLRGRSPTADASHCDFERPFPPTPPPEHSALTRVLAESLRKVFAHAG